MHPSELPHLPRRYPGTTVGVLLANALPFVGVVWGSWSVEEVLVFYWLETGVVAGFSLVAALLASERTRFEGDLPLGVLERSDRGLSLRGGGPIVRARNVPVVLALGTFIAMAWVFHGAFVLYLASTGAGVEWDAWFGVALLGVVANQGVEFHREQFVDERHRDATPEGQLFVVFGRTFLLHAFLLGGLVVALVLASLLPGGLLWVLVVLVVSKAPLELAIAAGRRDAGADREDAAPDGSEAPSAVSD